MMRRLLLVCGLFLLATPAHATCTSPCVQVSAVATASSGTTCSPVLTSARTAGDIIIFALANESNTATISSVADTDTNTYPTSDFSQSSSNNGVANFIGAAKNSKSGSGSDTITITVNTAIAAAGCIAAEFNPFPAPYTADQTANGENTSASASSGNTPTLSQSDELIFGGVLEALGTDETITAGSGFTLLGTCGSIAGSIDCGWEYQKVTSNAAIAATFTLGGTVGWDALCGTYYGTSGGAAKPHQLPTLGVGPG